MSLTPRVMTVNRGVGFLLMLLSLVIACDKREAFAQGSEATKQSILSLRGEMDCFASLAMTTTKTGSP
jgi:hypothetical protein